MPTNWQKTAKNSIKGQLKTHQKCKQKFAYNKIKSSQKHNQQACKINTKTKVPNHFIHGLGLYYV